MGMGSWLGADFKATNVNVRQPVTFFDLNTMRWLSGPKTTTTRNYPLVLPKSKKSCNIQASCCSNVAKRNETRIGDKK